MGRMLYTGDTVMVVYIYLLLFFSLSMKIVIQILLQPGLTFYSWTRDFNQAI
jgi:hypothetical protein